MTIRPSSSPRRLPRGFTLVEVLVTLAIMALVMMALQVSLHSTMAVHDSVAIEIASVREGPKILDLIERDLRSMHTYNVARESVLKGGSESHSGMRGDRLDFLTCTDSSTRIVDPEGARTADERLRMVACDINEVGYRLRTHPESADFMQLWRREDLFIDEEPHAGGTYQLLHDRVRRFEILYLTELGDEAEEEDEWDMEQQEELPSALVIRLELQSNPDLVGSFVDSEALANRIIPYTRTIAIAADRQESLKIRPVIPVKIDPNSMAGAGGAGLPGEGEGEGDGAGGYGDGMEGGENGGPGGALDGASSDAITRFNVGRGGGPPAGGGGLQLGGNLLDGDLGLNPSEQEIIDEFLKEYRNKYGQGDDDDPLGEYFGGGG